MMMMMANNEMFKTSDLLNGQFYAGQTLGIGKIYTLCIVSHGFVAVLIGS